MAARSTEIRFGAFRLDPTSGVLRDGDTPIALQPRPLALLRYLAERPGRVVSGDELLREVWPGTAVTRGVLKVAVRAIREALGDDAASPRFVETVGRKGYRFLEDESSSRAADASASPDWARARPMVGRDTDLDRLLRLVRESQDGTRRIVLIAGEAGIGKTTLLDHLLAEIETRADVCVARGQCLERHGEGEPYLPVLEALARLCRDGRAEWLLAALRRHAPSWIEELPELVANAPPHTIEEGRSTPERMLRELADALEVATAEHSLVLALEDLHWSDHATLDLLSCLAQRREPANLMVVGTYRPSEVIVYAHPLRDLKQQLLAKSLCEEIALEPLGFADVADYLRLRLGEAPDVADLAAALHPRTAGNALFVASVVDDLLANDRVVRENDGWRLATTAAEATEAIPVGVQQLIEQQAERLDADDRRLLEAASAVGIEFSVASVAAALELDLDDVEERCEALAARGQFIAPAGLVEWPDGTLCGRYRFRHPLRSHVLYRRIAKPRRVRLHRAIAAREEAAYGARAFEIAAELAAHFERGHDWTRAVKHHEAAAHTALRRSAPREAAAYFEHALHLLNHLSESREREEAELRLRVALAAPLMAMRGYAAPEVGANYERARALCSSLGAEREVLPVLRGLASHYQVRGELGVARALGKELLERTAAAGDPVAQVQADYGHGVTLFHAGEATQARTHFEHALALYRKEQHAEHARLYGGYDPGVACRVWLSWALPLLGVPEQAREAAAEALALAEELGHPLTLACARYGVAFMHQTLGESPEALRLGEQARVLAEEYGFAHELALATIVCGWGHAVLGEVDEGIAELRLGLERYAATGARLAPGFQMLLVAAEVMGGRLDVFESLAVPVLEEGKGREEALASIELHCGAARVLLALAAKKPELERKPLERNAESLLQSSLARARTQRASSLELLAATDLARLWQARGQREKAHALLAPILETFAEGLEARVVRRASRLLSELGSTP